MAGISSEDNEDDDEDEALKRKTATTTTRSSRKRKCEKKKGGKTSSPRKKVKAQTVSAESTNSTASDDRDSEDTTSSSKSKNRRKGSPAAPKTSSGNPFGRPSLAKLKKTGESFLQDKPCIDEAPRLPKCLECKAGDAEASSKGSKEQQDVPVANIFCRFYAFRRLRYGKNGQMTVAGFCDPYRDFGKSDSALWEVASSSSSPQGVKPEAAGGKKASPPVAADQQEQLEKAKYILRHLSKDFSLIVQQERRALRLHCGEGKEFVQVFTLQSKSLVACPKYSPLFCP